MSDENIVGIDLGTTISVLASMDSRGSVSVIPNSDGEPLTPSVIYLAGKHAIVGTAAKEAGQHSPGNVASFVKRDIGSSLYSGTVDGRQFRPETLSAIILKKLKQDAQRRIGPVSKAVITVPAFFNDGRRKATQDAGRIAGLDVIDIINEPTAAALAYCLEDQIRAGGTIRPDFPAGKLTALVYDLGGGTFDVTSIRLEAKRIDTLATDGAVELGGRDWDEHIVEFVVEQFKKQFGVELPPTARRSVLPVAENVKKLLTKIPVANVKFSYGGNHLDVALSRDEFEARTMPLVTQTEGITNLLLQRSQLPGQDKPLTWDQIDRILLVGGSTRMPMVKQMLRRVTGKTPDESLDPDQVVAKGAAILCAMRLLRGKETHLEILDDEVGQMVRSTDIVDVNAHALSIEIMRDGRPWTDVVIKKNRRLPHSHSKVYQTRESGATSIRIRVLEGEAPDPAACIHLGDCVITDLPADLPAKSPVQVWLNYGPDGIVNVKALDMTRGKEAEAIIHRNSGLTEEQIRQETEFVNSLTIE